MPLCDTTRNCITSAIFIVCFLVQLVESRGDMPLNDCFVVFSLSMIMIPIITI